MFESTLNAGRMFQNVILQRDEGKDEFVYEVYSGGLSLIIHLIFLKLNLSLLNSAHAHNSESNTNAVSVVSDQCFILNQKYKEIFQIFDTRGRNLRIKVINIHHMCFTFIIFF